MLYDKNSIISLFFREINFLFESKHWTSTWEWRHFFFFSFFLKSQTAIFKTQRWPSVLSIKYSRHRFYHSKHSGEYINLRVTLKTLFLVVRFIHHGFPHCRVPAPTSSACPASGCPGPEASRSEGSEESGAEAPPAQLPPWIPSDFQIFKQSLLFSEKIQRSLVLPWFCTLILAISTNRSPVSNWNFMFEHPEKV